MQSIDMLLNNSYELKLCWNCCLKKAANVYKCLEFRSASQKA